MTVAELIAKLQEFPPDAEVIREDIEWNTCDLSADRIVQIMGVVTVQGQHHGERHESLNPVRLA